MVLLGGLRRGIAIFGLLGDDGSFFFLAAADGANRLLPCLAAPGEIPVLLRGETLSPLSSSAAAGVLPSVVEVAGVVCVGCPAGPSLSFSFSFSFSFSNSAINERVSEDLTRLNPLCDSPIHVTVCVVVVVATRGDLSSSSSESVLFSLMPPSCPPCRGDDSSVFSAARRSSSESPCSSLTIGLGGWLASNNKHNNK